MQQRLFGSGTIKIATLPPEQEIRRKQADRNDACRKFLQFQGEHPEPGKRDRRRHHQEQCRQDPPRPAFVEIKKTEAACLDLFDDDRGDQKAADHKKHVNANETATEKAKPGVEQYDRHNRNGAQSVNLGAVVQLQLRCSSFFLSLLPATAARAAAGVDYPFT